MAKRRKHDALPMDLPRYDPAESLKVGLEILKAAGVPFALAGRLAVWAYVRPAAHQYTKDVDFAVPYGNADRIARVARERGYTVTVLSIGGIGIDSSAGPVDFIDRHPYLSDLFADAVRAAGEEGKRIGTEGGDVPVVPLDHLVAMKMMSGEPSDDKDVEELLTNVRQEHYRELRELVAKHLGRGSAERLDVLARRIGHPGPGMKRRYESTSDGDPGRDATGNA